MKVTSIKELEKYIYSSVIVPIKGLRSYPYYASPITGDRGEAWELTVDSDMEQSNYRRNYQRTQASRNANKKIVLMVNGVVYVVATYHIKRKWVKLYKRPFKRLNANLLMNKLYSAFYDNAPFVKIMFEFDLPEKRPSRRRADGADRDIAMSGGDILDDDIRVEASFRLAGEQPF